MKRSTLRVTFGSSSTPSNAGISRCATVVIAFLMYAKMMSLEQAFLAVKHGRPAAKPNEGFWKQLLNYEQNLVLNRSSSKCNNMGRVDPSHPR